jgi:hypothetical protein
MMARWWLAVYFPGRDEPERVEYDNDGADPLGEVAWLDHQVDYYGELGEVAHRERLPERCTACGDQATVAVAVGPLPYCAPCRDLIRRMERIDA